MKSAVGAVGHVAISEARLGLRLVAVFGKTCDKDVSTAVLGPLVPWSIAAITITAPPKISATQNIEVRSGQQVLGCQCCNMIQNAAGGR